MFNWLKRIRKATYILSAWEKTQLDRLARESVHYKEAGKTFYTSYKDKFVEVYVLGKYRYYDVDGQVSSVLGRLNSGEIIQLNWTPLYVRKPHDWVRDLDNALKINYSYQQKLISDDKLYELFFKQLPLALRRESKLNSLLK